MIGACAGLTGLCVALVAGLAADNPSEDVILRAIVALLVCQVVGWIIGTLGERTVRDAIRDYREANPINSSSTTGSGSAVDKVKVGAGA